MPRREGAASAAFIAIFSVGQHRLEAATSRIRLLEAENRQLRDALERALGECQDQVARPRADVVADVRQEVQAVIDHEGAFTVSGDLAAFVCR